MINILSLATHLKAHLLIIKLGKSLKFREFRKFREFGVKRVHNYILKLLKLIRQSH